MKQKCRDCGELKELSEFFEKKGRKNNKDTRCKKCWKPKNTSRVYAIWIKKKYGITIEEYESLLKKQDGRCAICGRYETRPKHERLCVDHNHRTGKVRGLLCSPCNRGIGYLAENIVSLENAIQYLKKHN